MLSQTATASQSPQANPPSLAPDGLPWPEGYFDRAPRVSLEEAIKLHGIRPSRYWKGLPVYTTEDCQNPNYIFPYPPETEWVEEVERSAPASGSDNGA